MLEHKRVSAQIKSYDELQGKISGYLAVFGNVDSQKDVIHPGAFSKTITEAYRRRENRGKDYLIPLLWMHDPEKSIGGYTELKEDATGLYFEAELDISTNKQGHPLNQLATEKFSGCVKGYNDEQSIGYEAIQKDYDAKTGIRNLREIRLWEGSLVTSLFASNELAQVTGVKTRDDGEEEEGAANEYEESGDVLEGKAATVCGATGGPIGPRDESWDGPKAKGQIFDAAKGEGSDSYNTSILRKYFMVVDGDPQVQSSWKLPFWYVGSNPHICVGAVKAIAGALGGARGAGSFPEGVKGKVETLYRRINAKYPDAPELTPPWKAKGKSFADLLAEEMCEGLLATWKDALLEPLTLSILGTFQEGNDEGSVEDILKAFTNAAKDWATRAEQYGMGNFLTQGGDGTQFSPMGGGGMSGMHGRLPLRSYMTRIFGGIGSVGGEATNDEKRGARLSAETVKTLQTHADGLNEVAATLKRKASDLTQLWQEQDQGPAYANDKTMTTQGVDNKSSDEARRRPVHARPPTREVQPDLPMMTQQESTEIQTALTRLGALTTPPQRAVS